MDASYQRLVEIADQAAYGAPLAFLTDKEKAPETDEERLLHVLEATRLLPFTVLVKLFTEVLSEDDQHVLVRLLHNCVTEGPYVRKPEETLALSVLLGDPLENCKRLIQTVQEKAIQDNTSIGVYARKQLHCKKPLQPEETMKNLLSTCSFKDLGIGTSLQKGYADLLQQSRKRKYGQEEIPWYSEKNLGGDIGIRTETLLRRTPFLDLLWQYAEMVPAAQCAQLRLWEKSPLRGRSLLRSCQGPQPPQRLVRRGPNGILLPPLSHRPRC